MGVQGLWELLAPVGRRVSVETLAGKKLAIDASIWMIQFMKAMRDEKGEMVRNAHLIGFFRRICKLLFLRTKPVFVFDGGTPVLKRRTVMARRRQRENAQAKIRKTAEKLLLNQLKAQRIEEIAKEIKNQRQKTERKGETVVTDRGYSIDGGSDKSEANAPPGNQETLDELLAASLAAEECGGSFTGVSTSTAGGSTYQEDEEDENEEIILPEMNGKLDPTILAALPPSMQLDLLVQMREKLMAENRQKYQKVKKAPTKFSELQIQAYLKTVAFRREIDEVQKAAAGRGVGGVQTSRIASEANREFIFSSSFTGDKQMLTAAGADKPGDAQIPEGNASSSNLLNPVTTTVGLHSLTSSSVDVSSEQIGQDIGTYIDDRGRVRVSRVRGLGIRVTRDLQRNLDMMKEFEQEKRKVYDYTNGEAILESLSDSHHSMAASVDNQILDESHWSIPSTGTKMSKIHERHGSNKASVDDAGSAIEISFTEDEQLGVMDEDNVFAELVAGSSVLKFSSGVKEKVPPFFEAGASEEEDVDWEEGGCDVPDNGSPLSMEHDKNISKGQLEEEADIQEAIRRSLIDAMGEKSHNVSSEMSTFDIPSCSKETSHDFSFIEQDKVRLTNTALEEGYQEGHELGGVEIQENNCAIVVQQMEKSPHISLLSKVNFETRGTSEGLDEVFETHEVSSNETLDAVPAANRVTTPDSVKVDATLGDSSNLVDRTSGSVEFVGTHAIPDSENLSAEVVPPKDHKNSSNSSHPLIASETTKDSHNLTEDMLIGEASLSHSRHELNEGNISQLNLNENKPPYPNDSQFETNPSVEACLDDEILLLRQEREALGDEQRKLERNAESVSSEMFAECQELLQMFGLPYIIAPMEAEAQCAYMELASMVDGVVTDDSDVFLFGARNVYKNIFDDRKYVETYFMKDIESELGLTREKLIRMALLLGSDYTEGVSGIGIVNAIEVVNAFPEEDGLQRFKEWVESPDPAILGTLSWKKKVSKGNKSEADGIGNNADSSASHEAALDGDVYPESSDNLSEMRQVFMDNHRNVSKNWHLPSNFPSDSVISAYSCPQVDESTEPFSWGKPDLFVLRKLCWEKFGWHNQKANELLIPVLKEYNKHETQLRLEAFYTFNERFAKIRSKRIKKAVKGITGKHSSDLTMEDHSQKGPKQTTKRNLTSKLVEGESGGPLDDSPRRRDDNESREMHTSKQTRECGISVSHEKQSKSANQKKDQKGTERRSNSSSSGRGRGRRGRPKEEWNVESTEPSSGDDEQLSQGVNMIGQADLRRSARSRNQVKYTTEELDSDGPSTSADGSNEGIRSEAPNLGLMEQGTPKLHDERVMAADIDGANEEDPNHLFESDPGDYLLSGGGFCADEDEPSNNPDGSGQSAKGESEEVNELGSSELSTAEKVSGSNSSVLVNEDLQANSTGQQSTLVEDGGSGVRLKAMPNLRRKRRKTG